MRYYLKDSALIIRGRFRAASNGVSGGIADVRSILNVTVPHNFSEDASIYLDRISNRLGFLQPQFGLLTAVPMDNLCITKYDDVMVFVTAAVSDRNRTINIIVVVSRVFSDAALLSAMMTASDAKMQVLSERHLPASAPSTDAIVIASEQTTGTPEIFAGPLTEVGERISKAVTHALTEAFVRFDNYLLSTWGVSRGWTRSEPQVQKPSRPSFFIYSRYGGDHWNEWIPEGCPYYPCHNFSTQRCSFCYCPLYPCMDTQFGHMIETPSGDIWSCMDCRFIHKPSVTAHLLANPEAEIAELKSVLKKDEELL